MNEALLKRVEPVVKRMRRVRFFRIITGVLLLIGIIGWLMRLQVESGNVTGPVLGGALAALSVIAIVVTGIACRLSFRNLRQVAGQIEAKFPSLDHRLLTAISQKDDQLGYLQQRVITEARNHSRQHDWLQTVPAGRLRSSQLSGLVAGLFCAAMIGSLFFLAPTGEATSLSGSPASQQVTVLPGNTDLERGTSLVVTARFDGPVPEQAELICQSPDGGEQRYTMTRNLKDPVLGGFIPTVDQSFNYRVITPDWQSESFSVDVFEFPALVRSDANLEFPEYTGMDDKRIEDTVRVSAVEGTRLTWVCFLNKAVQTADLVTKDGNRIPLEASESFPGAMTATIELSETQRLTLELMDEAGRANKYPPELVARVLPNQPPNLKLTVAGDVAVSPLEELPIEAEVQDDYGVVKYGLAYTFAMKPQQELVLGDEIPRGGKSKIEHLLEFEKLKAEPDDLLTYHFWAEDYGPDGTLRRTESDMYFAEVRPFEEIFREGEAPPGGQSQPSQQGSQNGQRAEELAELQKEIINATWRVIRDEPATERSEGFDANVQLLIESQQDALEQLNELAAEVQDERSIRFVDLARSSMETAISELSSARDAREVTPLSPAMEAEKLAYGSLLRLRAREFEVTRSQQQNQPRSSSSASQNRRQQQLDELELDQDENRYETESQAQEASQEEQQQREMRQVLNRLRDLARRQEDLNKELAQLQSALEQAETEEEKDEIERQLKRLREQQQDLLRETDELAERMQQPENRQEMSEASEQLEQTRENVRRASEALEQNDAAEALTAGRRAEREFEEMRDDFRQKAAGQFNEMMREMRTDAQQLDQKQEELSDQLRQLDQPSTSGGLRGTSNREQIREELAQQGEQLGELLERMRTTVEEAEAAEPLLAQKLYDSYRRTQQQQVQRKLEESAELLRRGFEPQAKDLETQAAEGLDQLREDLEAAAATVLGDETQALQRALSELEQLQRDLENEMQQNGQPAGSGQDAETPSPPSDRASSPGQPGQQGEADQLPQSDRPTPGDRSGQPGQGQPTSPEDASQQSEGPGGQPGSRSEDENRSEDQQASSAQQPGQPTPGQPTPGQSPQGQSDSAQQPGQQGQQGQQGQPGRQGLRDTPSEQEGPGEAGENGPGSLFNRFAAGNPAAAPLTGDGFREWSDRLRDVEEMVDDPQLRSEAAQIRDRARDVRRDFRRNSKEPQWDLVEELIATPLRELKQRVSEELLRRSAEKHAPVPMDRDPVPVEYADAVRQYYESLGSGR